MTKKLKKKVKKIALTVTGSLLSITALGALGTKLLTMPKTSLEQTLSISGEGNNKSNTSEEIITGNNQSVPMALSTANVASDGAIICDSLVQGARDNDLSDGNYTFRVVWEEDGIQKSKDYKVELINFKDNVTYSLDEGKTSKIVSLGDTTTTYKTLIVKYHKNLTIDKGVTVTATNVSNLTYKKGMYLCVMGDLVNEGTISMTARGTYNQAGEDVYLWKDKNGNLEYVPANGASGLPKFQSNSAGLGTQANGKKGNNGSNRQTGGGGQGGNIYNALNGSPNGYVGATTGGTSYSGGNGSGGVVSTNRSATSGSETVATFTNGGPGYAYNPTTSGISWFAGGGAGTVGGNSAYFNRSATSDTTPKGGTGTGGLLVIYANQLDNGGTISSNGTNGAGASCRFSGTYSGAAGGGGSRRRLS